MIPVKKAAAVLFTALILHATAYGQASDIIYQGNVAHEGYANNIAMGPFSIGFDFNFFGNSYNSFYINSNGMINFVDPSFSSTPAAIPSETAPNNFIAAFWDNLTVDPFGSILYRTIGSAPNRKLIVQFRNMGFFGAPTYMGTFQIILYEGSGAIQTQYRLIILPQNDRATGGQASIGIENSDGTSGAQYTFQAPGAISAGKAIRFTPEAGGGYTIDDNAIYEPVFLTLDLSMPEPGLFDLISPAEGGITDLIHTFEWEPSENASSYSLRISTDPTLFFPTTYNAGSNLSYTVDDLVANQTYYWTVFATNSTGTTYNEVRSFTASEDPPLEALPRTIWTEQGGERTITLQYSGGDGSPVTATINSLPAEGTLYQFADGEKGSQITEVPAAITDASMRVIYSADGGFGIDAGSFSFFVSNNLGDSPPATIEVNVSPPGMPNLLYASRGSGVDLQFDKRMSSPAGKESQFTIVADGDEVPVTAITIKEGDPFTYHLTPETDITGAGTVTVAYEAGDVTSQQGGMLASFDPVELLLLSQTIDFPDLGERRYGDADFNPGATASGGGTITYSSSDLQVATIVAGRVSIQNLGTTTITARQSGDATYAPARYDRPMTVLKGLQVIDFDELPEKDVTDEPFALSATVNSSLPISFSSSDEEVATISGNILTITGSGTTTITATAEGNEFWEDAEPVHRTLTVNRLTQTIAFDELPEKDATDEPFEISATATSGLPVSFSSSDEEVATISGNTITITGWGTATITATQEGDETWAPAEPAERTLTVNGLPQTITFDEPDAMAYGETATLTATSSSGLTVQLSSGDEEVATISGNSVTATGTGSVVITATQPGDETYLPAEPVERTLVVGKADQTITFPELPQKGPGDEPFDPGAVASSGLEVVYHSDNSDVAVIDNGMIEITGIGSAVITASQPGNEDYNAAEPVQRTLIVNKLSQTITFVQPEPRVYGTSSFLLDGEASSGLPVSFSSSNPEVAVISGNTVSVLAAGTTVITATQPGDETYLPAEPVERTLVVNKATLTFRADDKSVPYLQPIPELTFTVEGFVPGDDATMLDELPVAVTTATEGSQGGEYPITVQGGSDTNYEFVFEAGTLTITAIPQNIVIGDTPDSLFVTEQFTLTATATSGLPVQFESLTPALAMLTNGVVTGAARGTASLRAFSEGDNNYLPADTTLTIAIVTTHRNVMYLFTPNNDGINDYWEIPNLAAMGRVSVRVYNRWGQLMFADDDYNNRWDGTSNGRPLPEGAYPFIIESENEGTITGTVNIVR